MYFMVASSCMYAELQGYLQVLTYLHKLNTTQKSKQQNYHGSVASWNRDGLSLFYNAPEPTRKRSCLVQTLSNIDNVVDISHLIEASTNQPNKTSYRETRYQLAGCCHLGNATRTTAMQYTTVLYTTAQRIVVLMHNATRTVRQLGLKLELSKKHLRKQRNDERYLLQNSSTAA